MKIYFESLTNSNLLEDLLQKLTESPMSDEDRKDSEILRNILQKRSQRRNAALTPEEKKVLAKYDVDIANEYLYGDGGDYFIGRADELLDIGITPSQYKNGKWTAGKDNSKEVNLVDLVRKRPERGYAQSVNRIYRGNFQDKHNTKVSDDSKYSQAYKDMESASWDKRYHDRNLSNYDAQKDKIEKEYKKKLAELERDNQYHIKERERTAKNIDDIKNRFKHESLTESFFTDSDWYEIFDRLCDEIADRLQAPFELEVILRDENGKIIDQTERASNENLLRYS